MALEEDLLPEAPSAGGSPPGTRARGSLLRRVQAFLAALLLTMVGVMLLVLPWMPGWDQNYFSGGGRGWYSVWMSPYFRGAVSGVGVVNLLVSFVEVHFLLWGGRRRAPGSPDSEGPGGRRPRRSSG